eukprot:scaffold88220_cov54-Phaeocystis_antarctica.AAC.4
MSPQQANKLAHQNSDRTLSRFRASSSCHVMSMLAMLLRFSCAVHYGDGEGGNGGIGGASGGDGARASEGRSLVLNACLPNGLVASSPVRCLLLVSVSPVAACSS